MAFYALHVSIALAYKGKTRVYQTGRRAVIL
jgi:hypothetical protein